MTASTKTINVHVDRNSSRIQGHLMPVGASDDEDGHGQFVAVSLEGISFLVFPEQIPLFAAKLRALADELPTALGAENIVWVD